jgi:transketolase
MTTGSLGQGMSTAIGIALGSRLNGYDSFTYLILGDGECNEGQVWEGAMFAAHHKLGRLIAFIDWNKQQLDGYTKDVMDMGDIADKFKSFGWHAQTVDGHDASSIKAAVIEAKAAADAPSAIVLNTIKGYGCDFAEGISGNHHMTFTQEQMDKAIENATTRLEDARAAVNKRKPVY